MNRLPDEILLLIASFLPLKDRLNFEMVDKRRSSILQDPPPLFFPFEKDTYLRIAVIPGLRFGGVPVDYRLTSSKITKRGIYPWDKATILREVLFEMRPFANVNNPLESLLRKMSPNRVQIDGVIDNEVRAILVQFLHPKLKAMAFKSTFQIFNPGQYFQCFSSISTLILAEGCCPGWVGRIPNSVTRLSLVGNNRITNQYIADLVFAHEQIEYVQVRECIRIDTDAVELIDSIINHQNSNRGLLLKVIGEGVELDPLVNLEFQLHMHTFEILDCIVVQFYQQLIVVQCNHYEDVSDAESEIDSEDNDESSDGFYLETDGSESDDWSTENNVDGGELDNEAMESDEQEE